jgi:hypothetical protein
MHAPSEDEGLSLLIHGSPIRDDESGASEEHLLDYDSDGEQPVPATDPQQSEQTDVHCHLVPTAPQNSDMEMDQSTAGSSGFNRDSADSGSPPDAIYFQCRSARTAGYKDTLVSISQDDSFGKN